MICTFFGHRDAPDSLLDTLREQISLLITEKGVDTFYFGNQGAFDRLVVSTLLELKATFPHIRCVQVLSSLSQREAIHGVESLFPDGIEVVPKRFAISFRNRFMVSQADYVIGYATRSYGGAAQFLAYAEKKGRTVIRLESIW